MMDYSLFVGVHHRNAKQDPIVSNISPELSSQCSKPPGSNTSGVSATGNAFSSRDVTRGKIGPTQNKYMRTFDEEPASRRSGVSNTGTESSSRDAPFGRGKMMKNKYMRTFDEEPASRRSGVSTTGTEYSSRDAPFGRGRTMKNKYMRTFDEEPSGRGKVLQYKMRTFDDAPSGRGRTMHKKYMQTFDEAPASSRSGVSVSNTGRLPGDNSVRMGVGSEYSSRDAASGRVTATCNSRYMRTYDDTMFSPHPSLACMSDREISPMRRPIDRQTYGAHTEAECGSMVSADVVSALKDGPLWQQRAAELRRLHEPPEGWSDEEDRLEDDDDLFSVNHRVSFDKHKVK